MLIERKLFITFFFTIFMAAWLSFPFYSFAAEGIPNIMNGQTTINSIDGKTYYAGLTGNHAIFNADPNGTYGFKNSTDGLFPAGSSCIERSMLSPVCFFMVKGDPTNGLIDVPGRMMISRTYASLPGADLMSVYELPALFVGGINVFGDIYKGLGTDLDSLKLWGSNLGEGGSNTAVDGAPWNLKNYTFNPEAQVKWGSEDFKKNNEKIESLAKEGTVVTPASFITSPSLYLQGTSLTTNVGSENEKAKYPEGKTWFVDGSLVLGPNFTYTYYGIGTIIVKGNLIAKDGVNFVPGDSSSKLGIIVLEDN